MSSTIAPLLSLNDNSGFYEKERGGLEIFLKENKFETVFSIRRPSMRDLYVLGSRIGVAGAFGSAYTVTCRNTGAVMAAKLLHIPLKNSKDYSTLMHLYRNEVELLSQVEHSKIIKIRNVVLEPRCVYLVMDRCSGGDLFDTIGRFGGCLPEFEAARVGYQLLSALRYLHDDVHIAHLDIKLANILFDHIGENSDVKLIDFGLARRLLTGEKATEKAGTTSFMAPEKVQLLPFDHSADMWSLGIVLFVCQFGFNPFDPYCNLNDNLIESNIMKGFNPTVQCGHGAFFPKDRPCSSAAKDLISKLLRSNPKERFTAARALEHIWFKKTRT